MKNRILSIIALGIVSMFAAEVRPDLAWWAPPLAIGVLRAYILIESSRLKAAFPKHEKFANRWSYASSVLVAFYIFALFVREKIGFDLFMSLQAANVLLIGAELFYSRLSLIEPNRVTIETQKDQIDTLSDEIGILNLRIETKEETIGEYMEEIDKLDKQIELNSLAIEKHSDEIENYKSRIGSFESEQKADRLKIENQSNQIAQLKKQIETHSLDSELVAELRKGIAGPTGIHWLCDCNEPRFIGNKAKDKRLICNKCKEK